LTCHAHIVSSSSKRFIHKPYANAYCGTWTFLNFWKYFSPLEIFVKETQHQYLEYLYYVEFFFLKFKSRVLLFKAIALLAFEKVFYWIWTQVCSFIFSNWHFVDKLDTYMHKTQLFFLINNFIYEPYILKAPKFKNPCAKITTK